MHPRSAELEAATALGFDQGSWDAGELRGEFAVGWDDLSAEQRMHAMALGYEPGSWAEMASTPKMASTPVRSDPPSLCMTIRLYCIYSGVTWFTKAYV